MSYLVTEILLSDRCLSCILLLTLSIFTLKIIPFDLASLWRYSFDWRKAFFASHPFRAKKDRERALLSFYHFETLAFAEIRAAEQSYSKISRKHKRLGYEIQYPMKLDQLKEVTRANAVLARSISEMVSKESDLKSLPIPNDTGDLGKVREVLKHFVRDWSTEGLEERSIIYKPILDVLSSIAREERSKLHILVPGSGLGRLAWEISELGFSTTANELSPFMNLAFRFLLSSVTTQTPLQHVVYPFAHWFSHQRSIVTQFRPVSFPDILPRVSDSFKLLEDDFLNLERPVEHPSNDGSTGYDFIVTLFFIDTSLNIISTLEQIHRLLRPGGLWINLGPLLWIGGSQASLELSLDEVFCLVHKIGFIIDPQSRKSVDCEYTSDKEALMKWVYKAEFWVATKCS